MHIDIITDLDELAALHDNWEAVYQADPEAQFFLSHGWMTGWFTHIARSWCVLAAKPTPEADRYVAFFPLRRRIESSSSRGLYRRLTVASSRYEIYTGAICQPAQAIPAMQAFGDAIKDMAWFRFACDFLRMSDVRRHAFLSRFDAAAFVLRAPQFLNGDGAVDQQICPYIDLPDSWDAYLAGNTGSYFRRNIRRALRTMESADGLHITHPGSDSFENHLGILIDLWKRRWVSSYANAGSIARTMEKMITASFEAGQLLLPVLWERSQPIGARAVFLDRGKATVHCYADARDDRASQPAIGLILNIHTLQYAIAEGYKTYDFLSGNHPYKYKFGVKEIRLQSYLITRRNPQPRDFAVASNDQSDAGNDAQAETLIRRQP